MLTADLRAQLRARLVAHSQSELQDKQIDPTLHGVELSGVDDNGHGPRSDFLLRMTCREEEYRAMVELASWTYYGKRQPDPLARPYLVASKPGVAVPASPMLHLAVDVLVAVCAGTPQLAWDMLDHRDEQHRQMRQATVLGLLLWWLCDLALCGFPDRSILPSQNRDAER